VLGKTTPIPSRAPQRLVDYTAPYGGLYQRSSCQSNVGLAAGLGGALGLTLIVSSLIICRLTRRLRDAQRLAGCFIQSTSVSEFVPQPPRLSFIVDSSSQSTAMEDAMKKCLVSDINEAEDNMEKCLITDFKEAGYNTEEGVVSSTEPKQAEDPSQE